MTEVSSIFVSLNGRDVGLSTLLTSVDQKTQKTADSQARLQAQYARLAQTQGNTAQATGILSNALQNNGGASERVVVSLSQQLATLQRGGTATQQLANSTQTLSGTLGQLGGQLSSLGGTAGALAGSFGQLAGSIGTLGGIGAAIGIIKVGADMAVAGANADLLRQRFDSLAISAGTTGDALIAALRAASGGEISDLNLTLAGNKAQLLGVAHSAEEFGVLMGIARDRAQQMSISTTQAFDNLTTGLGRGSALILDNLGLIVSVKEANETYAASLGKTASALTEAEQKQALINAVLAQGRASLQQTGGAVESNAGKIQRLSTAAQNFGNAFGAELAARIGPTVGVLADINDKWGTFIAGLNGSAAAGAAAATAQAAEAAGLAAFDAALAQSGDTVQAEAAYQAARAGVLRDAAVAQAQAADAAAQLSSAYDANRVAALANADATTHAAAQIAAHTTAVEDAAAKAQIAKLASGELAAVQGTLAQAAATAANVILAGGGNIAATAARLAASSSGVDQLTAAYLRLAQAQAAATGQKLQNQTARQLVGADSEEADLRRNNRAALQEDRAAKIKAASDAAAAERNYQQTLGNTAPALAHARAELAQLTQGSAAYINKQNEIAQLQQKADRAAKGGGGVKLSDQQKLNNQLLTDQEKANDQFEDAEAEHQQKLLAIQIDYAKKTLAQQKANEISKRQSQEDFYDRLTSSDLNKKKGGADALKAIDAQYQADYQKSQELAQQGKAKQSADLLALAQKQAQDELTYQENLAKAQEAKDKAEISRLEAIHKLHQDTAAEERKQVLEGGDANEIAKQQALDEETARYDESREKIGTAAERAADRQEAAALRAGKAIDAVNTKLGVTKSTYDQIAPSGGGSAPVTSSGASAPPSVPTQPAPAASDALSVALDGLRAAIDAVKSATDAGADKVAGAVRGLNGKFAN